MGDPLRADVDRAIAGWRAEAGALVRAADYLKRATRLDLPGRLLVERALRERASQLRWRADRMERRYA